MAQSVVVAEVLDERWSQIPVPFGQQGGAARAFAPLPPGSAHRGPLLIEPAPLLGLPAQLWLQDLDCPGRTEQNS